MTMSPSTRVPRSHNRNRGKYAEPHSDYMFHIPYQNRTYGRTSTATRHTGGAHSEKNTYPIVQVVNVINIPKSKPSR